MLFNDENLHQKKISTRRKITGRRLLDPDVTNVYRCSWDLLTLLVWYPGLENKGRWSLPLTDRAHGESMEAVS